MSEKEVIITVSGGVAEIHSLSPGVNVKIVDFDVEGVAEKLLDKFEGSACVISEHEEVPVIKED